MRFAFLTVLLLVLGCSSLSESSDDISLNLLLTAVGCRRDLFCEMIDCSGKDRLGYRKGPSFVSIGDPVMETLFSNNLDGDNAGLTAAVSVSTVGSVLTVAYCDWNSGCVISVSAVLM